MGQTLYTATQNGSNGNAGTLAAPFKTISFGLARVGPGDSLFIGPGVYDENLINNIPSGTSWTDKILISCYPGEAPWIIPSGGSWAIQMTNSISYVEFVGINVNGANVDDASIFFDDRQGGSQHHILMRDAEIHGREGIAKTNAAVVTGGFNNEFRNLTVHGTGGPYAFYNSGNYNIIDGCDVYNTSLAGINIYHNGGYTIQNIVRNNRIHHISVSGFFGAPDYRFTGMFLVGDGNMAYNNIIYGCTVPYVVGNCGISVYNAINTKMWNNTIVFNVADGISINPGSTNSEVRNNILYGNTGYALADSGVGTTADHNLFDDPRFINAAAYDFRLQPGSPAIDAGITV